MIERTVVLAILFVVLCPALHAEESSANGPAPSDIPASILTPPDVNARYAARVADWLWSNSTYNGFINEALREEIELDIRLYEGTRGQDGDAASKFFDRTELEIAAKLSKKFAIRDLTAGLPIHSNFAEDMGLCVAVDPKFSDRSQALIQSAVDLLLQVAVDPLVIQNALDTSIAAPTPQPEMYQMKDGQPVLDRYGNKLFDAEYQFMRENRVLPPSVEFLQNQIKSALPGKKQGPGLLVVSHYTGNDWWGGGYYGFFSTDAFQLKREQPAQGYLYIRLNEDQMQQDAEHFDDPAFWASKISHEILHNLSYWHPAYASPMDRENNNQGNQKAFIYAYELSVFEAAKKQLADKK